MKQEVSPVPTVSVTPPRAQYFPRAGGGALRVSWPRDEEELGASARIRHSPPGFIVPV
jgi:hypothetical protein